MQGNLYATDYIWQLYACFSLTLCWYDKREKPAETIPQTKVRLMGPDLRVDTRKVDQLNQNKLKESKTVCTMFHAFYCSLTIILHNTGGIVTC